MSTQTHGRVKRISAEFRGDEAVEIELLEVSLRMGEVARTRAEADTLLARLALKALMQAMDAYCSKAGLRYPPYSALLRHLTNGEDVPGPVDSRIATLSK